MQEMVKIFQYKIGDEEINSVDARELHKILESKQKFADWIQNRLKATMADENIDYIVAEVPADGVFHRFMKKPLGHAGMVAGEVFAKTGENLLDYPEMPTNGVFDKVVKNSTEREEVFNNSIKNPLGGRPAKEYIITLDLAKEFSMLEKNAKGKEIRQYFIQFERAARREFENFCKEIKRLTTEISNLREKIQILEDLVASSDRLISMYKKQLEAKTIDEDIRRLVRRKEQLKQEGYL